MCIEKHVILKVWNSYQKSTIAEAVQINEEKEEIANLLKTTMESVVNLKVPLVADVNEGKNWAETK